tara:strand:- start:1156 stop:2283 length:1128 start_codon:yes stop_codon:yes gene_type:complete
MKTIISGDFFISREFLNKKLFSQKLIKLFNSSDFNIVNLESPIINYNKDFSRILKTGPNLSTNNKIIDHFNNLNIGLVTAANNHILDYGQDGLNHTINELREKNIEFVGIGKNLDNAQKYVIKQFEKIKIAVVNFCENEWSIAGENSAGANPLNLIDNHNQIKSAKENSDFVIVIIHGGHEYYNLPSPRMVKQYRFFAECGADLIVGHHTHCISGYEIHKNVPIFYGLGNMIFTKSNKNKSWYYGLSLILNINKEKNITWEICPIKQSNIDFKTDLLEGHAKERIINEFLNYSLIIQDEKKLKQNWTKFITKNQRTLNVLSPINIFPSRKVRGAFNKLGMNNLLLNKNNIPEILNHIRCEAHRDTIIELLKNKLK